MNQDSYQNFSHQINYNSNIYSPQTVQHLQTDPKQEQQHIQERARQLWSCVRYVPQLNIFFYGSQDMQQAHSGQVHMMVMPKCKEPLILPKTDEPKDKKKSS